MRDARTRSEPKRGPPSPAPGSPAGAPEDPINVVFTGGIYNPQKATCGTTCEVCSGYTGNQVNPSSPTVGHAAQRQFLFSYNWFDGSQHDVTGLSGWSSDNTSVLTVQTHGQTAPGLGSGVGLGQAHFMGNYPPDPEVPPAFILPVNVGQICTPPPNPPCPVVPQIKASGSATVQTASSLSVVGFNKRATCDFGNPYGVKVDITYQVWGQTGTQEMAVAGMFPCETVTDVTSGTTKSGQLGEATSAQGQFLDPGVGICAAGPITSPMQLKQVIQMQLPNASPPNGPCTDPSKLSSPVRTQTWTISTAPGGANWTITNGTDVRVTR